MARTAGAKNKAKSPVTSQRGSIASVIAQRDKLMVRVDALNHKIETAQNEENEKHQKDDMIAAFSALSVSEMAQRMS